MQVLVKCGSEYMPAIIEDIKYGINDYVKLNNRYKQLYYNNKGAYFIQNNKRHYLSEFFNK